MDGNCSFKFSGPSCERNGLVEPESLAWALRDVTHQHRSTLQILATEPEATPDHLPERRAFPAIAPRAAAGEQPQASSGHVTFLGWVSEAFEITEVSASCLKNPFGQWEIAFQFTRLQLLAQSLGIFRSLPDPDTTSLASHVLLGYPRHEGWA